MMRIRQYQRAWRKDVDKLKQDGHLLFKGQEIQEGIRNKEVDTMYERFMSPLNNLSKMSLLFFVVQIRVVNIWT
jgi:hypothetical protein